MARSTSNLGAQPSIPEEQLQGKGKAPIQDFAGFNPLAEPTSTLNTEISEPKSNEAPTSAPRDSSPENPQKHLEEARDHLQPAKSTPIPTPAQQSSHQRGISNTSSLASSFNDSSPASPGLDSDFPSGNASGLDVTLDGQDASASRSDTTPAATPGLEPMLNFGSLAAMIGDEDKILEGNEHIEDAGEPASKTEEEPIKEPSPTGSPRIDPTGSGESGEGNRSRGDSGESSASAPPPIYVESAPSDDGHHEDSDQISPAPEPPRIVHDVDSKDIGNVSVLDRPLHAHEATQ